eukprot:TRINITY_DN979_c0_g1_i1.p2 TRINITY_DN979_c0_g1~~TRINITY_DN979_c0_g1_i1.p2  ORF type:complete len:228 (-),score=49.21 TRINITY_DN979_c0_g1_i1:868-1551(-)
MASTIAAATTVPAGLTSRVEVGNAAVKSARVLNIAQAAPVNAKVSCSVAPESQNRRSVLGLFAAAVAAASLTTEAKAEEAGLKIPIEGPPTPFGGLPGTESADQARDVDIPLKERFYLQPLSASEAIARAKESADQIIAVKPLILKKAWPYVQNDLRSKGSYLRLDLSTAINAKPREEKKALSALLKQLNESIESLDYAARVKNVDKALASYDSTVTLLKDILVKVA